MKSTGSRAAGGVLVGLAALVLAQACGGGGDGAPQPDDAAQPDGAAQPDASADATTSSDAATDSATCAASQTSCTGTCVDTKANAAHCGGCGKACNVGQVCSAGVCGTSCAAGKKTCSGACVDTQVDALNCGACGKTCKGGEVCSNGACASTCSSPTTRCAPVGAAPYCANLASDGANCGVCENACLTGQECNSGSCRAAPLDSLPPVLVTTATCKLGFGSGKGRKVVVDPATHAVYLAMGCAAPLGGLARVEVVKTLDGGKTFGARVYTGIEAKDQQPLVFLNGYTIAFGGAETLYVAGVTAIGVGGPVDSARLVFTRSINGGASWSALQALDSNVNPNWGVHVSIYGDNVYVSARKGTDIQLYANAARGVGAFTPTTITMNGNVEGDVLTDPATGDLWAASSDAAGVRLRQSTDSGATFGPDYDVAVGARESGFTLAAGTLSAAWLNTSATPKLLFAIPLAAPTTSTEVALSTSANGYGGAALATDGVGNRYAAAGAGYIAGDPVLNGDLILDRILAGGVAVASRRVVANTANQPSYPQTAAIDGGAVMTFQNGNSVYFTVQKY